MCFDNRLIIPLAFVVTRLEAEFRVGQLLCWCAELYCNWADGGIYFSHAYIRYVNKKKKIMMLIQT